MLALVGILIGKYLSFVWTLADVAEEQGIDVDFPIFSRRTWDLFMDSRSDVWGAFDLLWIGLAAFTAFRIPGAPRASAADEPAETRP